jgi:hypothetical protein
MMAQRGSILLVANRTAQTAGLREAVGRIAESREVEFHLLVRAIRGVFTGRDHLADELIYAYADWSLEQAPRR